MRIATVVSVQPARMRIQGQNSSCRLKPSLRTGVRPSDLLADAESRKSGHFGKHFCDLFPMAIIRLGVTPPCL